MFFKSVADAKSVERIIDEQTTQSGVGMELPLWEHTIHSRQAGSGLCRKMTTDGKPLSNPPSVPFPLPNSL